MPSITFHKNLPALLLAFLLGVAVLLPGCSPQNTLQGVFKKQSPHTRYKASLKDAHLDETALGQQWLAAAEQALQTPVAVTLPFKETGYFPADKPLAASYRFTGQEGQKITVKVQTQGRDVPRLFLDLFEASPEHSTEPKQVAYADTTALTLEYEMESTLPLLLRVQPELLRSGQYTVTIETLPTLAFPVQGKDSKAVQSFWGAERDAGARRHEGIDIFAPRHTPVVASVEGVVSRVNVTPIGGKVVWLSDPKRRQSLYYAHLDSQLVQPGQRVSVGDTLGLMGNSGNVITTAPHLHFGIYRFGQGAVDPYPFVHLDRTKPANLLADKSKLANWARIAKANVTLRAAPAATASSLLLLRQHTPIEVLAGTAAWYRVRLADGQQGYVTASLVESLDTSLQAVRLAKTAPLLEAGSVEAATRKLLPSDTTVRVLARQEGYWLVRDADGAIGWISTDHAR